MHIPGAPELAASSHKVSDMYAIRTFFLAGALIWVSAVFAQDKPAFTATYNQTVTAQVAAIDHQTREVTLAGENGMKHSFVAGEEVRNLDQVTVGDIVISEYMQNISIRVVPAGNVQAAREELVAAARAEKGDMPGMEIVDTRMDVAEVVAIDLDNNTFQLKGADGAVTEYRARNPQNLQASEVGDSVVILVTNAVAVAVEKKPE